MIRVHGHASYDFRDFPTATDWDVGGDGILTIDGPDGTTIAQFAQHGWAMVELINNEQQAPK